LRSAALACSTWSSPCFSFGGFGALGVAAVRERSHVQYVGYTSLALAAMTKGPVALLLVGLCVAVIAIGVTGGRRTIAGLNWRRGTVIVLLNLTAVVRVDVLHVW